MRILVKVGLSGLFCLSTLVSSAQDATPLIDPPMLTATISPTTTFSPVPTYTATDEPTITPSDTGTPIPSLSTASPSPAFSPTFEPSTVEVTPEITSEPPIASFTVIPTTQSPTETIEATAVDPTLTFTVTGLPTPTLSPAPTETVEISGKVFYQNHGNDNSAVHISVLDENGYLIGAAQTDEKGEYTLYVSAQDRYQLVFEAFLHRRIQFTLAAGESMPDMVLAGGDLDADGCIGQADLDLFMSLFTSQNVNWGDITGDGLIDASDFAIVTGNYEPGCLSIEATSIPSPLPLLPTPSPTLAEAITPTVSPTIIDATIAPVPDPTLGNAPEGN